MLVTLDVEGVFFKTRLATLTSIDGTYFAKLFANNAWMSLLDKDGRIFIDRDASIFPVILNYLRDHDRCVLPTNEYHLRRVLREAVFFNILPLRNLIEKQLRFNSCTCSRSSSPDHEPVLPSSKPPPPPLPLKLAQRKNSSLNGSMMLRKNKKSAESISTPINFTHVAHVGWNGESILYDHKDGNDVIVKKICDAAAEVVDLNAVYNVVNRDNLQDSESVEVIIGGGQMQSRDGQSRH